MRFLLVVLSLAVTLAACSGRHGSSAVPPLANSNHGRHVSSAAVSGNTSYIANTSDATTVTFSGLPATAGDVQVCHLVTQGNRAWTLPANFAAIDTVYDASAGASGSNYETVIAYSSLVASPSFSVPTNARLAGTCIELSGVASSNAVDVHSLGYTASTAANASSVTPSASNELLLAFYSTNTASTVSTPPSGLTVMPPGGGANGSPYEVRGYYLTNSATSSQQPTLTWSSSGNNSTGYVVLKPSPTTAITVNGTSYVSNTTDATTLGFSGLPAAAGDVQLCHIMTQGNRTWTLPANFTAIDTFYDSAAGNSGTNAETAVAYSSLVANPTFTVPSNARLGGTCVELAGVASSAAIDVHSIGTQDGSSTSTSGAVTPTQSQEIFLGFWGTNNSTALSVSSAPSGFTEFAPAGGATGNPYQVRAYYLLNPSLASQQPSLTWSSSSNNNAAYVVLKPNTAPPPPPPPTCCTNGVAWPYTFHPYASNSIFNHQLTNPDNPQVYSQSSQMIANAFYGGCNGGMCSHGFRYIPWGSGNEGGHPVVFASSTDPLVNLACLYDAGNGNNAWGTTPAQCWNLPIGTQIRIPVKARPASGPDHHLAVVEPDGTEYDFWAVSKNQSQSTTASWYTTTQATTDWVANDTLDFMGGGTCNFYTGNGISQGGAATAGGLCMGAGYITTNELQNKTFNHALYATSGCADPNTFLYPARTVASRCDSAHGYSGPLPVIPVGALLHVKDTVAQINAMSIGPFDKAVLIAMHNYGMYLIDTNNGYGAGAAIPNPPADTGSPGAQFVPFGTADPNPTVMSNLGWAADNIPNNCSTWPASGCPGNPGIMAEYRYADSGWNPFPDGWQNHLEILDPCNAQQPYC